MEDSLAHDAHDAHDRLGARRHTNRLTGMQPSAAYRANVQTSPAADLPNPPAVPGQSLTFGLAEALGCAIVSGRFEGRGFPTEAELTRRYGASRSIVREVIKALMAKGLLSARPRVGTIIEPHTSWRLLDPDVLRWLLARPVSRELLGQFIEMRLTFEPEAAGLAAQRTTPAARDAIAEAIARVDTAGNEAVDLTMAEAAFHVAVLEAAENPFVSQLTTFVVTATELSDRLTRRYHVRADSQPQRRLVAEAVLSGDSVRARDGMRTLLLEQKTLIERLGAPETQPALSAVCA